MSLPPCGLYRTSAAIGEVEAGRLVYFHNHGEPGPGIYLPKSWKVNRAVFSERGTTLENDEQAETLESLASEGLYRVKEAFVCCARECRTFEAGLLVQLGYNGAAEPLLFVPHWHADSLHLPDRGFRLDELRVEKLDLLKVESAKAKLSPDTLQ